MTDEKRYELICSMLRSYDAISDGVMNAAEEVIRKPHKWTGCDWRPFYAYAAQMLLDARQGMDKKTTGAGRLSALNRIYKNCADSRPSLKGFFPSGDRWAICDGYRFIRLNSKPESIPEAPQAVKPLDLDKIILADALNSEVVNLPSAAEVKAAIADLKSKYGRDWNNRHPIEALPGWWCNPQYLLDMIQALPDGTAHKPENCYSPLYYHSEDGDAILLPVRHTDAA